MKAILTIIFIMVFSGIALCADIVQIADVRDDNGKWSNWTEQAVTWDLTILPSVPDHDPIATKALQTWFFPVENGWVTATFSRNKLGVYALRWSHDDILWSDPVPVEIKKPGNPSKK